MSNATIAKMRKKAQKLSDEDARDAAAKEARKRWQEVRDNLASTADHLTDAAEEQWEHARHAAEEQWEHAREAATPTVKKLKKRAAKVVDEDLDRLRSEAGERTGELRKSLVRVGMDLRDASRNEADRVIAAIHESAQEAREAEHKRRVRALIGWTAFGMVAGAVLAIQFGPKSREDSHVDSEIEPDELEGHEVEDDEAPAES